MKKYFTVAILMFGLAVLPVTAQITTGKPVSHVVKTGNRPQAGDFGLYLGITSNMFGDMFDSDVKVSSLPLVNLKYMMTNQWEARLGFQLSKTRESLKGDALEGMGEEENADTYTYNNKYVLSEHLFTPGVAYHFNPRNLLDVYVGAELPFGWGRDSYYAKYDDMEGSVTKTSFKIGAGAFIGLQAFVADLPLAIGVEYGLSTMVECGLKYKYSNDDQEYFSPNLKDFKYLGKEGYEIEANAYDKLKARKGSIGNQFRITLTYYFK